MELDRCQNMPPPPSYGLRSDGLRGDGLRDRSRSPEPFSGRQSVDARIHVEVAELKDKLEQTQNELRRTQAELRLNTGDYERSHVELEQMQEKVSVSLKKGVDKIFWNDIFIAGKVPRRDLPITSEIRKHPNGKWEHGWRIGKDATGSQSVFLW